MVHDFNFGPAETYPEWKFEEADKNLNDTMLNALITTGIVDPSEKWIRNYIGIPSISAEEQEEIDEKKKERDTIDIPDTVDGNDSAVVDSDNVDPSITGNANVQGTALNGAQVQALLMLIQEVADKQLPIETGRAIVQAAFPLIDANLINTMFSSIKSFKPPVQPKQQVSEVTLLLSQNIYKIQYFRSHSQ